MIDGGYYIKPRCIENSKITHAPPHVREIWDWLIRNAVFDKEKKHGNKLERGQVFCTTNTIRQELCWYVGFRKEMYKKASCENAMKWLVKEGMINTTKTTRGSIVTICNYSHYQDPKNYECRKENGNEGRSDAGVMPNDRKEDNNKRSKEYIYTDYFEKFWLAYPKRKGSNPKKPAAEKFKRLVKNGNCPDEIIRGAINYERQEKDLGNLETPYVAQAVTWLNQERWKEPEPKKRKKNGYQGM